VMIEQNTPLNIQMMEDFPTTFDLPYHQHLAFSQLQYKIPVPQMAKRPSFASNEMPMTVLWYPKLLCQCCPIILVARKLVILKKSVCIACEIIEWSYPGQGSSKSSEDAPLLKNKKSRNKELEKLAEKLNPPNKTNRKSKHPYIESAQEQSSSRAKRLRNTATNINKEYENEKANPSLIPENVEANDDLGPESTEAKT
ncbi:6514_t:CDS:2, partial [Racocetra persica]